MTTHLIRSTTILMVAFFINKVLAIGRQVVIAPTFGTGSEYDAYIAAFRLPDILYMLISGGALATAFIPVLSQRRSQQPADDPHGWRLVSAVLNTMLLAALTVSIMVAILAQPIVTWLIAPGFDPATQHLTAQLMRLVLISTIIFSLSGLIGAVLHTRQHFVLPAIAPILYNLGIIGGALFLAPHFGVYGLIYGTILGAAAHLLIQLPGFIYYATRDATRFYFPLLGWHDPDLREVVRLMGPRLITLFVIQFNFIIMYNLASRLGEGSVSALDYGWDLMQMPQTIIGTAIGIVLFPTMAELAARHDRAQLWQTTLYAMRIMLILAVPAMVGLIVLGRPVIQLMFERGKFGPDSTAAVYQSLQFWAIALVGHCLMEVANRYFYAQKDTFTPLITATFGMFLNLTFALALYQRLDAGGLALSNGLAVSLEVIILLIIAYRQSGLADFRALGLTFAQTLFAAIIMGGLIIGLISLIPTWPLLAQISISGLLGLMSYGLIIGLMGMAEVRELWQGYSK